MDALEKQAGPKFAGIMILVGVMVWAASAAHGGSSATADIARSGEIAGAVEYCGAGGMNGVLVHIPGESFTVYTGPTGAFRFRFVPEGTYTVRIVFSGHPAEVISPVVVVKKRVADLGTIVVCPDADNDGYTADIDCDDLNPAIYPGAEEDCDGYDNDCDGLVDEGCQTCSDLDRDGYFAQAGCGTAVDCNDDNRMVNPGASEQCDGIDNDCDGMVDEDFDQDGDGITVCGGDCDDSDPGVGEGFPEVCDGLDNDCDGSVDEGCPTTCTDGDGDGYYAQAGCGTPVDCDDNDPQVGEPMPELCDEIDNDCDGLVDENFNLRSDPNNCGACNMRCDAGGHCIDGVCVY